MGRKLLHRTAVAVAVLWVVFSLTFVLTRLTPGGPFDPVQMRSPAVRANLEQHYGLKDSPMRQYLAEMGRLVTGDLGLSLTFEPGRPVVDVLSRRLWVSVTLGGWAFLLAVLLGVPAGVLAGLRPGSWTDRLLSLAFITLISLSVIVIAGLLKRWALGPHSPLALGGFSQWRTRVLPVATLGLAYAAILFRLVRSLVLRANDDKLRLAVLGRGVAHRRLVLRYVLPAALIPLLSYLGPFLAGMLTGSFVVESQFDVPGVAACFIQGAAGRDYPLLTGAILVYTALLVTLNLLFETLHDRLDGRRRSGDSRGNLPPGGAT